MQRKSILKDTIQLTVVQFFLEWVSLLLNVWLTHRIWFCNCRNCCTNWLFFSAGCGRCEWQRLSLHQPLCIGGVGKAQWQP